MSDFDLEETKYGFRWGPMRVVRSVSDPKYGVEIMITNNDDTWSSGKHIFVRMTPGGKKIEVREDTKRLPKSKATDETKQPPPPPRMGDDDGDTRGGRAESGPG